MKRPNLTTGTGAFVPTRSDSGPVGAQFRDALGVGSSDNTVELSPQTEAALASRGLEIRQRIGKGGYGVVFRVRDSNTGPRRAVKVLIEPGSETAKQSFQRERRILDSKKLPGKHSCTSCRAKFV